MKNISSVRRITYDPSDPAREDVVEDDLEHSKVDDELVAVRCFRGPASVCSQQRSCISKFTADFFICRRSCRRWQL